MWRSCKDWILLCLVNGLLVDLGLFSYPIPWTSDYSTCNSCIRNVLYKCYLFISLLFFSKFHRRAWILIFKTNAVWLLTQLAILFKWFETQLFCCTRYIGTTTLNWMRKRQTWVSHVLCVDRWWSPKWLASTLIWGGFYGIYWNWSLIWTGEGAVKGIATIFCAHGLCGHYVHDGAKCKKGTWQGRQITNNKLCKS